MSRRDTTAFLALAMLALPNFDAALAQVRDAREPIRCECGFEVQSGYIAVGTRAVCSSVTHSNFPRPGQSCKIAFGATGYEEPLVSQFLRLNVDQYREIALQVTQFSLISSATGNPEEMANVNFLTIAIPFYMRAAYLREGAGVDQEIILDLDEQISQVASEFSGAIASVFLGDGEAFTESLGQHTLVVQRGAIRFIYNDQIDLVAVFFIPE